MTKTLKRINRKDLVKQLIALFFIVSVVFPLVRMLIHIGDVNISKLIFSSQFKNAFRNSITTSVTATLISVGLAFVLAWIISRSNIKYKGVFTVLLTVTMLIPSISHGMGLIILFGANGILTNFFNLSSNIYGFWGIIIGSVMYSFPIAFLMISDILKYEDSTPYDAADILGFSLWDKFKAIFFPYIRKPMISVLFATLAIIITDYGVPLIVGGKITTLPVLMYQEVIGLLDFNKGAVIGAVLLIPAVIAFILDLINQDEGNVSFITQRFEVKDNKLRDILSYSFIAIVILFVSLPLMAFVFLTFVTRYPSDLTFTLHNVLETFKLSGGRYLVNSLIIATTVSTIGTILAYITSYLTARTSSPITKFVHLIAITSLAIPGLVLGLSYVMTFKRTPIYGTILILILVNLVHFFASPYLMMYNTFGKINQNLESVGETLGISRIKMIKDVFIPQTIGTILEMFSYFFVNSMITISAVSFLANTNNKPISLLISQFEGNMLIEASAFVSLLILAVNVITKMLVYFIKRSLRRRGYN